MASPAVPSPTGCKGRRWHADEDSYGCTNVVKGFSDDAFGIRKEYDTLRECCNDLFSSGEGCD